MVDVGINTDKIKMLKTCLSWFNFRDSNSTLKENFLRHEDDESEARPEDDELEASHEDDELL